MRHLRSDYDAIQPFPTQRPHNVKIDGETVAAGDEHLGRHMDPIIPDDEPVFILRSKDVAAPDTVRYWANDVEARGGDVDLCSKVRAWADEMEEYGKEHGRKTSDTPKDYLR
jgi:hypothetical protein